MNPISIRDEGKRGSTTEEAMKGRGEWLRVMWVMGLLLGCCTGWADGLFIIGGVPEYRSEGEAGWEIRWGSEAGRQYRLERSANMRDWEPVGHVTASGVETVLRDTVTEADADVMFWRVARLGDGVDGLTPVVSNLEARMAPTDSGEPLLVLSADAVAPEGVVSLHFLSAVEPLEGQLTPMSGDVTHAGNRWTRRGELEGAEAIRYFQARARDGAEREGRSALAGFVMVSPELFEPLAGEGLVRVDLVTGRLQPFVYRPGGSAIGGRDSGMQIAFPQGGRLVADAEGLWLEFTEATADMGSATPLQLREPLRKSGPATVRLAVGRPIDPLQLREAFTATATGGELPPSGIPVVLFGRFSLIWEGGRLTDTGIERPQFRADELGIPLPAELSAIGLDTELAFNGLNALTLPFVGDREIAGADGTAFTLRSGSNDPFRMHLNAGGELTLGGGLSMEFASGLRFAGELKLEDAGTATFSPSPATALIPLFGGIAAALVSAENTCPLPPDAAPGSAVIADTIACMERRGRLLVGINTAAAAFGGTIERGESLISPSDPLPRLQEILVDAVAQLSEDVGIVLPTVLVDAVGAIAQVLTSETLRAAEAIPVIAQPSDLRDWLERMPTLAAENADIAATLLEVILASAETLRESYLPPQQPYSLSTLANLWDTVARLQDAALLLSDFVPLQELLNVLTADLIVVAQAVFELAEQADDAALALEAARYIERGRAIVAANIADAPPGGILSAQTVLAALGTLAQANADRYEGPLSLSGARHAAQRIAELLAAYADQPQSSRDAAFDAALQRICRVMDHSLAAPAFATRVFSSNELLHLLAASVAMDRVRGSVTTCRATPFAAAEVPALVGRIIRQAALATDNLLLYEALQLLLQAADAENRAADRSAVSARGLLVEAERIMEALTGNVLSEWELALAERTASPIAAIADLALPGVFALTNGNAELRLDLDNLELSGGFSGSIALPGLDGLLNLSAGEILPGGHLRIAAFGSLTLPGGIGSFTVDETNPIELILNGNNPPAFSGSARVQIGDEIGFSVGMDFLDPLFALSIESGELNFDFGEAINSLIPRFPGLQTGCDDAPAAPQTTSDLLAVPMNETDGPGLLASRLENWNEVFASALGMIESGETGSAPDEQLSDELLERWIDLQIDLDVAPDLTGWGPRLTLYLLEATEEIIALDRQFAAVPAPPAQVNGIAMPTNNFAPKLFNVDIGSLSFSGEGPAHVDGMMPADALSWRSVTSGSTQITTDAFGNPVTGISLQFGRIGFNPENRGLFPQWSTERLFFFSRDEVPGMAEALWNTRLTRDGVLAVNLAQPQPEAAGIEAVAAAVRMAGLGSGFYAVYGINLSPPIIGSAGLFTSQSVQNSMIQAGRIGQGEQLSLTRGRPIIGERVNLADWIETSNYGRGLIELQDADELVVAGWHAPQVHGTLQAFQIVETLPRIPTFRAVKKGLAADASAEIWELSWQTEFATSVSIRPGPGSVDINGTLLQGFNADRSVVLTATNASGSVTARITIRVDAGEIAYQQVLRSVQQMNRKYRAVGRLLDRAANDALTGGEGAIDFEAVRSKLDEARDVFERRVLTNPQLTKNQKVLREAARAGIDLAANYGLTSTDDVTVRATAAGTVSFADLPVIVVRGKQYSEGGTLRILGTDGTALQTETVPADSLLLVSNADVVEVNAPLFETSRSGTLINQITGKVELSLDERIALFQTDGVLDPAKFAALNPQQLVQEVDSFANLKGEAAQLGSQENLRLDFMRMALEAALPQLQARLGLSADGSGTIPARLGIPALAGTLGEYEGVLSRAAFLGIEEPQLSSATHAPLLQVGYSELFKRQQARINRLPKTDWRARGKLLADQGATLRNLEISGADIAARLLQIRAQAIALLPVIAAQPVRLPPDPAEFVLLELAAPAGDAATDLITRAQAILTTVATRVAKPEWSNRDLDGAIGIVESLIRLHRILEAFEKAGGNTDAIVPQSTPVAAINSVTDKFLASVSGNDSASAKRKARFGASLAKLLKQLPESARAAIGPGEPPPAQPPAGFRIAGPQLADPQILSPQSFPRFGEADLELALLATAELATAAASDAYCTLAGIGNPFANLLGPDFSLPGGLRIERAAGSLLFNTETGFLRVDVGGILHFEDLGLRMNLESASIDSDGNYAAIASGSFRPNEGGELLITRMDVNGNSGTGSFAATGDAILTLELADGPRSFGASVSYDAAIPLLTATVILDDAGPLHIADDFVVFPSVISTHFSAGASAEMVVAIRGAIGLFARGINPDPQLADFRMQLSGAGAEWRFSPDGFAFSITQGQIDFTDLEAADCGTAGLPAFIQLSPLAPLTVSYQLPDPSMPLGRLAFSGSLALGNARLPIPGFEVDSQTDLTPLGGTTPPHLDICAAILVFDELDGPALFIPTGDPATLRLPFSDRTVEGQISNLVWPLTGLPTFLEANLLSDEIVIGEDDGFRVVLGDASGTLLSLRAERPGDGSSSLEISGSLRMTLPSGIIASSGSAAAFTLSAPLARVRLGTNTSGTPFFAFDPGILSASGDFVLPDVGIELRDVALTVSGLGTLFSEQPNWQVNLNGGRLLFDGIGNAEFMVDSAAIASNGSFALDATTTGSLPLADNLHLSAAVDLAYQPVGGFTVSGGGSLRVGEEADAPTFAVALGWDGETLQFASSVSAPALRFTDDFALFEAGVTLSLSATQPVGSLTVGGSAGLLANRSPLPALVEPGDYLLSVTNVNVRLDWDADGFSATIDSGSLRLPPFMSAAICPDGEADGGPEVALAANAALTVRYNHAVGTGQASVSFGASGSLTFCNFGFAVPELEDLAVAVCHARLSFPPGARMPTLDQFDAVMSLPLPDGPVVLGMLDAAWSLDGFPTGRIVLIDDIDLFNQGGFRFTLLGTNSASCAEPTGFSIERIVGGPQDGLPEFTLSGGIRFSVPAEILVSESAANSEVSATVCSGLRLRPGSFPELLATSFGVSAEGVDWRLGGEGGLIIEGASLQIDDLQNLFDLSPTTPLTITLGGGFRVDGVGGFNFENARFRFEGGGQLPTFSVQRIGLSGDPSLQPLPGFPLQVTAASLRFKEQNLPIIPATLNGDWLFAPDNLIVTISAELSIAEIINGRVDDLELSIENGAPKLVLAGFGFGIDGLDIPPLTLAGQVYIGNLNRFDPDDPATIREVFFAGMLGGKVNGAGVKAVTAFRLDGLIGICLDVSAGPVGIPLGPTGFFLTGAEGGVSFANRAADPCDFNAFIRLAADGRPEDGDLPTEPQGVASAMGIDDHAPVAAAQGQHENSIPLLMTWAELREVQERAAVEREVYRQLTTASTYGNISAMDILMPMNGMDGGPEIPCPTGDCPPASVNIFCSPHPDPDAFPNRVIIKFSSLNESFLNEIGLSRSQFEALGLTTASAIAIRIADDIDLVMRAIVPEVDPAILILPDGQNLFDFLSQQREIQLTRLRDLLEGLVFEGVNAALGASANVYDALLGVLYAGVPCPDFTIKLTGTFSHASVSSFLSGTGGVILSTTGSAGVVGSVNLLGLPVGQLRGFISVTDSRGDPNPSACGNVNMAFGPVELGSMQAAYSCDGCVTGLLNNFANLLFCLSDGIMQAILERVAPDVLAVTLQSGGSVLDAALSLDDEQRIAFVSEVFINPLVLGNAGVQPCLVNFAAANAATLNPEFLLCGEVQPKLFGFSMGDSLVEVRARANRNSFAFGYSYSPSQMTAIMLGSIAGGFGSAVASMLPPVDQASFGVAMAIPDILDAVTAGFEGKLASPDALVQFAEEGFEYLLTNTIFTMGYRLAPFGLELFNTQARLLLPNLVQHPANPAVSFTFPEARNLPSREAVLLAALQSNLLDNPLWKGDANDIHLLFPEGSPEATSISGLQLAVDYFPHGGVLSASVLNMPNVLYAAPPPYLGELFNPVVNLNDTDALLQRIELAGTFISDYLLGTTEAGALAFYVPAPNPPFFNDGNGQPLTPRKLLDAILNADESGVGIVDPYPIDALFLSGYLDGQLFGIPLGRADVSFGTEEVAGVLQPVLRFDAVIPDDSWFSAFLPSASVAFEMRQPPTAPITQQVAGALADLQALLDNPAPSNADRQAFLDGLHQRVSDGLPKLSLEAELALAVPEPLRELLQIEGGLDAGLYAYSINFNPSYPLGAERIRFPDTDPANPGPYTLAVRRGGIVLGGSMNFGFFPSDNPAENLVIRVDEATLALTGPSGLAPFGLSGRLIVDDIQLPSYANPFGNAPSPFAFRAGGTLFFNSNPDPGAEFLRVDVGMDGFQIGPFLQVGNLNGANEPLEVEVFVAKPIDPEQLLPAVGIRIEPVEARIPLLGDSFRGLLYGSYNPVEDSFTPFTFSTVAGQPWEATMRVEALVELRSPLDPQGPVLLRALPEVVDPNNPELRVPAAFTASLTGIGMEFFEIRLEIPNGMTLTVFPGQATEASFTIGSPTATCLIINSDGRVYYDSGTQIISLVNGMMVVEGRIEFGFEPFAFTPQLEVLTNSLNFGSVLTKSGSMTQTFTVKNSGVGRLVVDADVLTGNATFTAQPNRVVLGPLQSETITVRYTPQSVGAHVGSLQLNSGFGTHTVALNGTGTGSPLWHVNPTSVSFGTVSVGQPQSRPILVTNAGIAPLTISSASITGPFHISPTSAIVAPGTSREFTVTFSPTATPFTSGAITFVTNTSIVNRTVSVNGSGGTRFWHRQRQGGPDLRGGHQIIAAAGWAVGDAGTVLHTSNGGRLWQELPSAARNWRDIVFEWIPANSTSVPANLRGLLIADDGHIEITRDSGTTWEPYLLNGTALLGGVSWQTATRRAQNLMALAGVRNGNAYIATEQSLDQWEIAEIVGAGAINGIAFMTERLANPNTGLPAIAAGENGTVLISSDGSGKSWQPVTMRPDVPANTRYVAVSASQQNTIADRHFMLVGQPGVLLVGTDGLTWELRSVPAGLNGEYTAGAWTGNTVGQLGTSNGQIWRIESRGTSFFQQFAQPGLPIYKVLHTRQTSETGGDSSQIWTIGAQGSIMRRTTDPSATGFLTVMSTPSLEFGSSQRGLPVYRDVVMTNSGTVSIDITAERASGSTDFSVFPTKATLPPGESATFTVTATPSGNTIRSAVLSFHDGEQTTLLPATIHGTDAMWLPRRPPSGESFVAGSVVSGNTYVLAAERSIWRTTTAGANWSRRLNNTNGPLRALSFADTTHGFAVGGTGGSGSPSSNKSTIYHTANGGSSWTAINSPVSTAIVDVVYLFDDKAAARRAFAVSQNFGTTEGRILSTGAGTTTWSEFLVSNLNRFDGSSITRRSDGRMWITGGSEMYTLDFGSSFWEKLLDTSGKAAFRRIFRPNPQEKHIWAVGDAGNYLSAFGGEKTTDWINRTDPALGDIIDVRFVSPDQGWIVTRLGKTSRIYGTNNGGQSWQLELLLNNAVGSHVVNGLMGNDFGNVHAFGSNGGFWQYVPAQLPSPGYLNAPVRIDLGTVGIGDELEFPLMVTNLGASPALPIAASIETASSPSPFDAEVIPREIDAGRDGVAALIRFKPTASGEFHGVLHLASNAINGDLQIQVSGRAVPPVSSVILDTIPSGITVNIGGQNVSTPRVFTVSDSPDSSTNWQRNSTRQLTVPTTRLQSDVNYAFSHWSQGGNSNTVLIRERGGSQRHTATFVQTIAEAAPPASPPQFLPTLCGEAGPPDDVDGGPWLKISHAVVRFPTLGDGHSAAVEGSLFLSLTRANGALRTSAFRLTSEPADGGFDVLAVSAGSWRFDLEGTDFQFVGNNPGVRIFDRPLAPPSAFRFRASWNPQTPLVPPFIAGDFSTLDRFPVLPGIVEFGPTTMQFALSPQLGFSINGTVDLLRRPERSGFFITNRPFSYAIGTPVPVEFTGTTTLVDFGFAAIRGDSQTRINLGQNANGVFFVELNDLIMDGWGVGNNRVDTDFFADGGASITVTPGINGYQFGPLRFQPIPSANPVATIEINVLQSIFRANLPSSEVNPVVANFWPSGLFTVPAIVIDSTADFEFRVPLPSSIGGFTTKQGPSATNYLIFERKSSRIGFRARNQQSTLFGDMSLRFAATSSSVSGTLSGTARVPGFNTVIGSVALTYDSSRFPPFEGRFGFPSGAWLLRFSPSSATICTLDCNGPGLSDCTIGICSF